MNVTRQHRKTQPPSTGTTHPGPSPEKIIPSLDLSRYRANPQLKLLTGPVMDPLNDSTPASDSMAPDHIEDIVKDPEPLPPKEVITEGFPEKFRHDDLKEKDLKTVLINDSMQAKTSAVIEPEDNLVKKCITISDGVKISFNLCYLIRENNQIIGYCDDLSTAIAILNRIAANEIKKREKKSVKVFRRDLKDGTEVQICTQSVGLWNGAVKKELIIDTIPVPIGQCS